MGEISKEADLLQKYTRSIVHMRSQLTASSLTKFGLVFGAGVSKDFKVPNWDELIKLIAKDKNIKGQHLLKKQHIHLTLPFKTQMLFEHFRKNRFKTMTSSTTSSERNIDYEIMAEWRDIIRKHLYNKAPNSITEALESHPYIKQYLPIIKRTHMTVNYNFDDFLERSLAATRTEEEKKTTRGYETVTNASLQFRSQTRILYHPNGFFPSSEMEHPSDRFIFSEHAFADQLINLFAGDYTTLLNHFSKNTCLLIGLSLEDQTLRNLLRQTAKYNPGHVHYYVQHVEADKPINECMDSIIETNFKVYNLRTLFLNTDDIATLGTLLNMDEKEFCDLAEEHGINIKYAFYITGALGVGKSTTLAYFRNLITFDEWVETRLTLLAKDWKTLSDSEKDEVDKWIMRQFRLKNNNLRSESSGICLVDRGPLDPLVFTPDSDRSKKAAKLLKTICPGQAKWEVEPGSIIILEDDENELELRMKLSGRKDYTANTLKNMATSLRKLYESEGVHIVQARHSTPREVAQRIAEIIHLRPYESLNVHNKLKAIKDTVCV